MVVTDVDGNRFLDFAAGIAVCSTGHAHPKVSAAIKEQADRLIHIAATDFYEPRYLELMERLAGIAPFAEKARVFLTNSGTEAVEGAIKLARYHTHRPGIIAFEGGFHGRTMGALSLTNSKIKQRAGFGPLLPMVHHAPFPRVRGWREQSGGDGSAELEHLRKTIFGRQISPKDVAAIVVEPIQGEGGYFTAPPRFLRGLRELCDEHGIVLIADEIQSGMGRTGRWWAIEHAGVEPDIVTVGQGHRLGHADRRLHRPRVAVDVAAGRPWLDLRRQPGLRRRGPRDARRHRVRGPLERHGHGRAPPHRPRGGRERDRCGRRHPRHRPDDRRGVRHPRGGRGRPGGRLPAGPADARVRRVLASLQPAADRGRGSGRHGPPRSSAEALGSAASAPEPGTAETGG